MDTYVVKVQFEDSLRRLSLEGGELALSYAQLVTRTKDLFQIPATAQLIFTYTDRDGDVVTMAEDQDLRDALVFQGLNPLRLHLAIVSRETEANDVKMNDSVVEHEQRPESKEEKTQRGNGDTATARATPNRRRARFSDTGVPGEQVVHRGILCNGCGMTPITGPRHKSISTEDYDLCHDCFEEAGVDRNDYIKIKIGRPDWRSEHFARGFGHGPRNESVRHHRHGMDRRGCPERACENGRWEKQSGRAVHHGVECDDCKTCPIVGPRFKSDEKFNYDLCQNCFQRVASTSSSSSDEYTRIDHPSHHNSLHMSMPRHYRLVSPYSLYRFAPYGRPFCGRRLRRIVVTSVTHEDEEEKDAQKTAAAHEPNAGAPAPAAQEAPATSMDVKMSEQDDRTAGGPENLDAPANQPETVVGSGEVTMTEVGGKIAGSEANKTQAPTNNPTVNATGEQQQPATEEATAGAAEDPSTHDGKVAKLASMGFNDNKQNEELLKKNSFDLRSTLDDLLAVKNWDLMLEELQEMGFYDSDLNRRLLAQNDGKVKPVVKELVRLTKGKTSISGE